jgi:hypothetical protein
MTPIDLVKFCHGVVESTSQMTPYLFHTGFATFPDFFTRFSTLTQALLRHLLSRG